MRRLLPVILALVAGAAVAAEPVTILNASYDVAREFYKAYNPLFVRHWHAGSSKQARAVIDGLDADVVTMNQASDIDAIAERGRQVPRDWATRFPDGSAPFTSTILFLVRSGNPKGVKDWGDLAREGVSVVIPNPKTSGNGRYSYLAAWAWAKRAHGGDEGKARDFVAALFRNVPVLDTGGRGATTTFVQRGIGDVLLTFENEVQLIRADTGGDGFTVVVPSLSILAESPVAVVEKVAAKRRTTEVARAYLQHLWSPEAQELAATHGFRPRDAKVLARHAERFPALELITVQDAAGGWAAAQAAHFADGALFDQIYRP
jgi:sulfate transport system substrate-binding protein